MPESRRPAINGLEVTPRLSSDRMKKSGKSLPEIGAELRVGSVLQGSVQKAGDPLRISVRLIDVASQRLLWSRIHDIVLTIIFSKCISLMDRPDEAIAAAKKAADLDPPRSR